MFEQLQGPKWYRKRPQNSGFLAVVLAFIAFSAGPWVLHVFNRNHVSNKKQDAPQPQETQTSGKHLDAVEIVPPPQVVPQAAKPKPAPLKCRCHIDTQAAGEGVVHHNSRFAICSSIDESDKSWHPGFYFRASVQIRWHCVTQ